MLHYAGGVFWPYALNLFGGFYGSDTCIPGVDRNIFSWFGKKIVLMSLTVGMGLRFASLSLLRPPSSLSRIHPGSLSLSPALFLHASLNNPRNHLHHYGVSLARGRGQVASGAGCFCFLQQGVVNQHHYHHASHTALPPTTQTGQQQQQQLSAAMGESNILKGRHYMQLFILALLFMFAIFTRKSIWIYYVRCRRPIPRPLPLISCPPVPLLSMSSFYCHSFSC